MTYISTVVTYYENAGGRDAVMTTVFERLYVKPHHKSRIAHFFVPL